MCVTDYGYHWRTRVWISRVPIRSQRTLILCGFQLHRCWYPTMRDLTVKALIVIDMHELWVWFLWYMYSKVLWIVFLAALYPIMQSYNLQLRCVACSGISVYKMITLIEKVSCIFWAVGNEHFDYSSTIKLDIRVNSKSQQSNASMMK